MSNRIGNEGEGRRGPAVPKYGDGASLTGVVEGTLADYVRQGGKQCPKCGGEMQAVDLEHESHLATAEYRCSNCGLGLRHVYRLVDAY